MNELSVWNIELILFPAITIVLNYSFHSCIFIYFFHFKISLLVIEICKKKKGKKKELMNKFMMYVLLD